MNDLKDVEKDRNHPKKKFRPIASGKVTVKESYVLLFTLIILSVFMAAFLNLYVLLIIVVYFVMNILYTLKLKHYVIIDCFIIAIGFVLRLISGGVLLQIEPSSWIIVCTFLLSLFLALNKRKSELVLTSDHTAVTRDNLKHYSMPLIDSMLNIVCSATFISYCIYTLNVPKNRFSVITIIPVLYAIFRYQYLVINRNEGGSVEETLLKDKSLMLSIITWIVMFLIILYI
jgi:4-hydroxybenzoate polyprenyltransferase